MRETIMGCIGAVGAGIAAIFGGWNSAMATLLILMGIDYITGMLVAGLFHNSPKTESGLLDSHAGWKGLAKKCMILLFVLIANRLDIVVGTTYIRDAVCIAYIANEMVSIVENAGLMGVPIPSVITDAIDALKNRKGAGDGTSGSVEQDNP